jgi:hypothetical protein
MGGVGAGGEAGDAEKRTCGASSRACVQVCAASRCELLPLGLVSHVEWL